MKLEWFTHKYAQIMSPSKDSENYDEWARKYKRYRRLCTKYFSACLVDRNDEYKFIFDTHSQDTMLPFEYKKIDRLEDLMYERAHELSKRNEIIQFFWSGGVDSTAALLVLKDVCPKEQFFVQMTPTSIEENPLVWEKLVKNLPHKIYKGEHLFSVANTKYLVVECGSADQLYNSSDVLNRQRSKFVSASRGFLKSTGSNLKRTWYIRRRFACVHRRYRFFAHSPQDQLKLDNIQPFYDSPDIEQYFMNKIIDGSLTYTIRGAVRPDGTYQDWTSSKSGPIYKTMKQEFRDILREFDKDMGDNLLGALSIRPNEKSLVIRHEGGKARWGVMAITETGKVIHRRKTLTTWARWISDFTGCEYEDQ